MSHHDHHTVTSSRDVAGKPSLQWYPGDWFKSEDVRQCSPATRGIWIDLIMYAFNRQSYGEMTGTVEGLARMCGATIDEMETAVTELEITGAADVSRTSKGVVTVVCRRLRNEQEEREGNAEYMREYRARKRQEEAGDEDSEDGRNGDVSESKSDVRTEKDPCTSRAYAEEEVEVEEEDSSKVKERENGSPRARARRKPWTKADVEAIYEAYPRHVGRDKALQKIEAALVKVRDGPDAPEDVAAWLLERTEAFAESPAGNRGQFTPHPKTWFHQGRYNDDEQEWYRTDVEESGSNESRKEAFDRIGRATGSA